MVSARAVVVGLQTLDGAHQAERAFGDRSDFPAENKSSSSKSASTSQSAARRCSLRRLKRADLGQHAPLGLVERHAGEQIAQAGKGPQAALPHQLGGLVAVQSLRRN